jgi:hypothetical protein
MKTTGYYVWLYGERYWHRCLDRAIARAERAAATYCDCAQVIEVATGALVYGRPA